MKYDILLIGGNGFVGRVIAAQLQAAGYSVLIPTSHVVAGRELRLLPKVHLEDADVHDFDELQNLCGRIQLRGAVINLVGVLHDKEAQPYGKVFKAAHVDLPKNIITAMQLHGLKRYLHMSALGANSQGPSMYQRSKGDGELAVKASSLDWTIFRPSVIFGAQDQFINLFSKLTKLFPALPLANYQAQFQPVSVDDVASAFVGALTMPQTIHQVYDLVGPTVYSMKEIVELAARKVHTKCVIIPVPAFVGYLQALAFEFLPGPTLMSRDNIASMQVPNVLPVNAVDALPDVFKISRRSLEGMR
ncbi:complex I NDUFA9 subunit family protein [Polynucleobacter asymbioticus]|jgi:NADH dehydrogenase|uniref:NAD-dependent epimerase/dehydratase n=1 Tax=Polynucleobacter asymbioticus (strain DSM 18221 / CIP 109841 / QLW-P1DMWA-1) TaxID=312153 RepID=A4T0E5_POLAQ|nr:complex I NDUFA9 subunit family protein [Polynucleobacter asymbioticus]ABP35209.1 NAD-dependent epimerase/dehydratase [Polynucleobacter asymbioticus QLW-P1DMWA-1]APC06968.1 epimerase [Polynucleobacter asymbioticus]